MKNRLKPLFVSLIVIGSAAIAQADSATWTGTTDGDWHTPDNWNPSGIPNAAADIATFNAASSNTTVSIENTGTTVDRINFSGASTAAYTLTGTGPSFTNMVMSTNNGGVFIDSAVTTNQDLSGIPIIRPGMGDTINFSNQGSGSLKLGTFQGANETGTLSTMVFKPGANGSIEIVTGKVIDNGGTGGVKKIAIILDDVGTLRIGATGNYNGTDAEGNSVTIRRGTLIPNLVIPASATRSSLGTGGRIQFGEAGQTYTATLRYENADAPTTDRPFHFMDGNTGVFDIVDETASLELTGVLTASGTANGGGNLTKKGLGTLKISGATNTYNGITRIEAGTLILGDLLAIQNSAYDTSSPGTLDLSLLVGNPTFGGLTSATAYNLPSNLTLSPPSGRTVTFSGILGESSPILELTKSGSGTQVLAGDNTFTGNVFVTAGRLTLAHSNALGLADPNPPYDGRKGLIMQGSSRSLGLTGGITIPAYLDFFVSSNSFDGGGIENVSGNNEIQAQIYFSSGNNALNISSAADTTLTISGDISMTQTTRTLYLGGVSENDNTISGDITETFADGNPNPAIMPLVKQGAGKWILSGTNTYKGATTVTGGTLIVASGGVINNTDVDTGTGTVAGGTLLVDGGTAKFKTTASNLTALLAGDSTNSGNITVTNNGTLSISTGRLILGGSGATPAGTSVFTQDSGTTTVASNLYTANFAATDLNISGGDFTGSGSATISQRANTNFNISGTANVTFPTITLGGVVNTTYDVNINLDGGTLAVNNIANSIYGNTAFNFNGGTLKARQDNGAFLVADTATIADGGGTIDTQAFDVTIGQALTRLDGATTDSLTKLGIGILTLAGTNTYGGDTTVNGGTLVLANGGSTRFIPKADASSNKITGNGSAITLNGAIDIDLTDAASAPDTTSWLLVDVDNVTETFGANFIVTGFTEEPLNSGIWKNTVSPSTYTFTESDGRLVKTAAAGSPFSNWMSTNFPAITAPDNAPGADPDGDGVNNLAEFAFAGDPTDGSNNGLIRFGIEDVGGTNHLTYTFACRSGATFTGTAPATASVDGVDYSVRASLDLSAFTLAVDEVSPAITTGLPAVPSGYTYRTFRVTDPQTTNPKAFIQVETSPTAP